MIMGTGSAHPVSSFWRGLQGPPTLSGSVEHSLYTGHTQGMLFSLWLRRIRTAMTAFGCLYPSTWIYRPHLEDEYEAGLVSGFLVPCFKRKSHFKQLCHFRFAFWKQLSTLIFLTAGKSDSDIISGHLLCASLCRSGFHSAL